MGTFKFSGGVEVMGFISPTDPSDQYPVIDPLYGIDGLRNVNTILDLDNIPELRRRAGMVVGVSGGTAYYKLNPPPWNFDFTDWSVFNTGGGSSGDYLPLSGGTVTGSTTFTSGLFSNAISATTYQNLPTDIRVTGGTYFGSTITFSNNTGGTFTVTGITSSTTFTGGTVSGATNFTNGLTANTISATTYQNLPQDIFVTGGTYTNGEILFKNNAGNNFTVTGLPIGGAGGEVYYLNLSQTQTPYKEFSPIGTNLTEQTTGVTISSGVTSTITSFLTPTGYPNTTKIPAGVWSFYLHSYKDTINASFDVFCEVYVYTTGGTETLLLTTAPAEVLTYSPTTSMELTDGYYSGSTIDITDRILVKVRTTNTGSQTNTITFFTEGQQNYSYGITPFSNFNALTCETLSGCTTIVNLENNKVNKGGDTMTGTLYVPTISATTYQNLPTDIRTTGGTYSNNTFTFTNNTGGTYSTLFNTLTGVTVNGNLSVTGNTSVKGITGTTALFSGSGQNIVTIVGSGSTLPLFSVQGSSGELFSVTDSLTGSLFSVNDISGLPILEVFSDNTTLMGDYLSPSLNTTKRVSAGIGTTTIYSIPISAYTGAFFDYTVSNGTNLRSGNIMSIFNSSNIRYSETSTTDIGNTSGITFNMIISGGTSAVLQTSGTTAGWTVKTIIRSI
jgi:hypothetical protein